MISDRAVKQLLFMQARLRARKIAVLSKKEAPPSHPRIRIGQFPRSGCFFARAEVDGLGEILLVEQNPQKESHFARAVREGAAISWVVRGDEYLGYAVVQLPGDQAPALYTREGLRLALAE